MNRGRNWQLALPMYNTTPALTRAWEGLLGEVIAGLRAQGWTDGMEIVAPPCDLGAFWRSRDVLLTQTCGYPFVTQLIGDVQLIATPQFDVPGCAGTNYCSFIVVRTTDSADSLASLRGGRAVINQPDSQSGMNALRHCIAPFARDGKFFSAVSESGSHLASLAAVQNGEADVAAVDCVTFAYAQRNAPEAVIGVRVLCATQAVPGLPLIGSITLSPGQVAELREVLAALASGAPAIMGRLALSGFTQVSAHDYKVIGDQAAEAKHLGYPAVA